MRELVQTTDEKQLEETNVQDLIKVLDRVIDGEHITQLPSINFYHQRRSVADERILMQDEVKRISEQFNEEQQKLDLIMKMQQARQRQNLQRKLLEKKQATSNSTTPMNGHGQQQPMRGLNDSAVYKPSDKVMPSKSNDQKNMSSRGLNLTPLLRK